MGAQDERPAAVEEVNAGLVHERAFRAAHHISPSSTLHPHTEGAHLVERPTRMLYVLLRPSQQLSQEVKR